jgi:signal transduction histidine kinase
VNELFLQMLEILPPFLRKLSGPQMELFRKAVEYTWFESKILSSREEREIRKQVEQLLIEWKVSPSDEIARTLVSVGLATKIHEIKDLLQSPFATEMVDMIFYLSQLKSNIDNIGIAAQKTRKTAQALKSYSHNSQQENRTLVNLQDNINLILTLYHNQMKYGVDLTTNYHDDVVVYGNPDELGQVWTNLLQNALQAMDNKGSICINVFRQADEAVVEFKDSGPGIPAENLERIFEPYFTTKPQGVGTGLGLSICQSIIQKYRGTVSCVSKPGETVFTVRMKTFSGVELEDAQMVQTAS